MKAISLFLFLSVACSSQPKDESPTAKIKRQIGQCYEESDSIRMSPPLAGDIKYKLNVEAQGRVREAKILSSDFSKDRNFEACVTYQIKNGTLQTALDHKAGFQEYIIPLSFKR